MEQIINLDNLASLGLLMLLQAVLGFDNLLYISLDSMRAPAEKQKFVRKIGIGIAIVLRIVLLLALLKLIQYFQDPVFGFDISGIADGSFNFHSIIVLSGCVFIIYTSIKEIFHMISLEDIEREEKEKSSVGMIIFWIVAMNLVFSFDSILSAMALSKVFWLMAKAIVIGGLLMIWLTSSVASFLQKSRLYEVLGLFILFVVGIMLLSEGGHLHTCIYWEMQ